MRLKPMEGPLVVHNGNDPNLLNSPKRINTLTNTNVTNQQYLTCNNSNLITTSTTSSTLSTETVSNAARHVDVVQWCPSQLAHNTQKLITNNNINNRAHFNNNQHQVADLHATPFPPAASSVCSESPDDSLLEYEDVHQSGSSLDVSPQDEDPIFDISDCESLAEDANLSTRGIVNPNYPGFQHFAHTLSYAIKTPEEAQHTDESLNNNNNDVEEIKDINRLDSVENIQKVFYEKEVFAVPLVDGETNNLNIEPNLDLPSSGEAINIIASLGERVEKELERLNLPGNDEELDTFLTRTIEEELREAIEKLNASDLEPSATKYDIEPNTSEPFRKLSPVEDPCNMKTMRKTPSQTDIPQLQLLADHQNLNILNPNRNKNYEMNLSDAYLSIVHENLQKLSDLNANASLKGSQTEREKFSKEENYKEIKRNEEIIPRKKEKMELVKKRCDPNQQFGSLITVARNRNNYRHSTPSSRSKKSYSLGFDVYNIETAMPKIDLDAIENHLKAAREEERRKRTDREEIRRRLAMGSEEDYYSDRPGRKPSLQARLQSGMNLQICFMNETASDTDSPSSDSECPMTNPKESRVSPRSMPTTPEAAPAVRPATLAIGQPVLPSPTEASLETNFFAKQAKLQTEARMALAQAKEMARMQMEIERQRQAQSPITEMVRHSLQKVGIAFPEERRRLSRQILTEMNVAQLQVIVNDLHTQIETLNEVLMKFLMERDDLHMEQDSMLVDIEDLTRYLGAKEQNVRHPTIPSLNNNTPVVLSTVSSSPPRSPLAALNSTVRPHLHRIASLVKK